jgi:hypothetical protein
VAVEEPAILDRVVGGVKVEGNSALAASHGRRGREQILGRRRIMADTSR